MKLPSVTRKFWIITVSMSVVAALLAFYLLIYVKDREAHMVAKNYRALSRLGKNILDLKNNYAVSIKRFNDGMARYKGRIQDQSLLMQINGKKINEILRQQNEDFIKQGIFPRRVASRNVPIDSIELTLSESTVVNQNHFYISTSDFLARSNLASIPFSDFFLVRVFHFPLKKTKSNDDSIDFGIAYQTFDNHIELRTIDSLVFFHHGIESIPLNDIMVAGVEYKIFGHRLKFRENEDWILCGATRVADFKRAARAVDSYHMVFALLIVLLVLLAMPILKLLIMNSIERLRLVNVWFTGFAILVGTAVFVLIILSTNQYLGYKESVNNDLKKISESVEKQFLGELGEIYKQLTQLNEHFKLRPHIGFIPNVFTQTQVYTKREIGSTDVRDTAKSTFLTQDFTYPFFYDLMWSDHKGDQHFAISSHFLNPLLDLFNLSKRTYFLNARDRNVWTLPHKPDEPSRQFAMQSIRSWIDGSHAIGFSVPLPQKNGEAEVISMVTKLNSVMNPLLPPGYGFCIVDEKGEAWFHSETNKNTQENFIDEADKDDKIIAAIRGRMAVPFESTYHGENHRMYIQPINNLPLYIVTFYDLNYYKAPLILTIGFGLSVTLLMFGLLGVQLFLQYLCVYKPTKLKIQRFYLHWIRPRLMEPHEARKGSTMNPSEKYTRAIVTLGVLAVLSVGLLFMNQAVTASFCLLVLPLYIFPFLYLLFEQETIRREQRTWGAKNILFHPFVWLSALLIILVNIALFKYVDDFWIPIVLQIVFLATMNTGFRWKKLERNAPPGGPQPTHLYHHGLYKAMIFLWLLVVSVLPVFSFYRTAFQQEYIMWIKYLQWEGAGKETARQAQLMERLSAFNGSQQNQLKAWGNYLTETSQFSRMAELDASMYNQQKAKDLYYLEFISRPQMFGIISGTRSMLEAGAEDEKWVWYDHNVEPMLAMKYTPESDKPIHYIVPKLSLKLWESDYFVLFLVVTATLAVLIYYITLYAIRSIFGLGIVMDVKLIDDCSQDIKLTELLHDNSLKKVFLVGLPYAGKSELLNEIKANFKSRDGQNIPQNKICEVNFITHWTKPVKLYDEEVLILKNFDHGINNHTINQKKLEWIQKGIDENASIIISCNSQPSSIIDFYELAVQRLRSNNEGSEKKSEYKQAIRLWKNILSGFVAYYQPLRAPKQKLDAGYFVRNELEHGTYLPKLAHQLKNESTDTYEEQENFVMKVEELADTYYHSLWNSFSHDEKFLLYDLAKDRFVNLRNVKAIRLLLQKGIIVAGDSLQLMNKSFNDFILHVVNEDEEMKMQHELNQKGSWNAVYTVLVILLFGLMVFIMLAQQNLLNDINLMLGVLGSLAAIFTRFGGLLSSAKKEPA